MGELEDVLSVVSDIHAAALDPSGWPRALKGMTSLLGGNGASFEVVALPATQHTLFHGSDLPAVDAYLHHYAPLNGRLPFAVRQKPGALVHEGLFADESAIERDPFYMEFLSRYDMRYFLGGVVANSPTTLVLTGVQRSARQGLPTTRQMDVLALLLPHLQQAYDVMRRLAGTALTTEILDAAVGWLADAVVSVDRTGRTLLSNRAAEAMQGVLVRGSALQFVSPEANRSLDRALSAVADGRSGVAALDFVVRREDGPPVSVAVRPAASAATPGMFALVFIHDPAEEMADMAVLLRSAFGLTAAEARLANALRSGMTPEAYAEANGLSPNTAYTHVRRIKDKTGAHRTAELVKLLNRVGTEMVRPA